MAAYATAAEFRLRHRRNLPDGITDEELDQLLDDASVFLRASFVGIPEDPPETLRNVLRVVTIALVKRTLLADQNDNAESVTDTAGPFTTTQSFRNSEGNLYISGQEREMIHNELAHIQGDRSFQCITAEGY